MRTFFMISSLLALVVAAPAAADVFTVTLTSGNTFVTRYQPHQSDTREDTVMLLTEFGNWISLPKEAIATIASDTESKGFGTVLDSQTIALGWVPPSSSSQAQADGDAAPQDPTAQLLQFMMQQSNTPAPPPPVYSNELIVEPSQSTGIPIGLIDRN